MLQEPLLVVAAFALLFLTVIIYVRLDFSIAKVGDRSCISFPTTYLSPFLIQDENQESRFRVENLVEQVQKIEDERQSAIQSIIDAIHKFKSSKDQSTFQVLCFSSLDRFIDFFTLFFRQLKSVLSLISRRLVIRSNRSRHS